MPTIRDQIVAEIQRGASLPSVMARYAKEGIEPEDLDEDLDTARANSARRKAEREAQRKTEAVGLPSEATATTVADQPDTPTTEWNPTSKLAGVGQGLMEGVANLVYPRRKDAGRSKVASRAQPSAQDGLSGAAAEELARRSKLVAEKPFIERLGADVGNVFSSIPAAVMQTVGPDVVPAGEDPDEVARKAGQQFGEAMPRGVAGSLGATVQDPWGYLQAEPFSAALDFVPALGAAGKGLKAAAYGSKIKPAIKAVQVIERAGEAASKLPGKGVLATAEAVGDVSSAAARKLNLGSTADWLDAGNLATRAQRFFGDAAAHPLQQVQALTRDLLDEPRRIESAIAKRGEKLQATKKPDPNVELDVLDDFEVDAPREFGKQVERPGSEDLNTTLRTLDRNIELNDSQLKAVQRQIAAIESSPRKMTKELELQRRKEAKLTEELSQQQASREAVATELSRLPQTERVGLGAKQSVSNELINTMAQIADLDAARRMSFEAAEQAKLGKQIQDLRVKQRSLEDLEATELSASDARSRAGQAEKRNPIVEDVAREFRAGHKGEFSMAEDRAFGDPDYVQRATDELGTVLHNPLTHRELLRDTTFRKAFQKNAGLSDRQMQPLLQETTDASRITLDPVYQAAFDRTLMELPVTDKTRKKVVAATVSQMAEEAGKAARKRLLDQESSRLSETKLGKAEVAPATVAERYTNALVRDVVPQQALRHGVNPSSVADGLEAVVARGTRQDGTPLTSKDIARLNGEAKRLRTFKQLDQQLVGTDHWVDPLLHGALTAEAAAQQMMRNQSGFGYLVRQMKANLTARNPKSALTNLISNSLMQAIRTGDPTGGVYQMIKSIASRKSDPSKWAALERTGLFDSSMLKQELAIDNPLWHNKMMEKFYQSGDVWFKAGEANRAFDEVRQAAKDLTTGESITLPIGPGKEVTLLRRDNDWVMVDPSRKNMNMSTRPDWDLASAKNVAQQDLDMLFARAAAHRANQVFFDYGDVPGLAKFMRAQPALGILSPFYSYMSKAIDVPGKGGLGTRIVGGSQGWFDSTSGKVLAKQAGNMLAEGASRSAMTHSLKQSLLDRENEEINRVLQYMPSDARPAFVSGLASPNHLAIANLGNWNVLTPSLSLARLLTPVDDTMGAKAPSRMGWDPAKVRLLRLAETGHLGSANDALGLLGMGGSAITDILAAVDESERSGKDVLAGHLFRSFAPALLGGGAAQLLDLSVGAVAPDSQMSSRLSGVSARDPKVTEDFVRWALRKTTGLGWHALKVSDSERTFNALGKKWKMSLDLDATKRNAEKLLRLGKDSNDEVMIGKARRDLKRVKQLGQIVDNEMSIWHKEWKDTVNKVFGSERKALRDKP